LPISFSNRWTKAPTLTVRGLFRYCRDFDGALIRFSTGFRVSLASASALVSARVDVALQIIAEFP